MGIMKDKGIIEDFDSLDKIVKDIDENYIDDEEGEWIISRGNKRRADKTAGGFFAGNISSCIIREQAICRQVLLFSRTLETAAYSGRKANRLFAPYPLK